MAPPGGASEGGNIILVFDRPSLTLEVGRALLTPPQAFYGLINPLDHRADIDSVV